MRVLSHSSWYSYQIKDIQTWYFFFLIINSWHCVGQVLRYSKLRPSHKPMLLASWVLLCLLCSMCVIRVIFSWPHAHGPSSWSILPHGHLLLLLPFSYSISSSAFLILLCSHRLYSYPIRDYWGALIRAHRSVQCPCPDYNLILGYRTQHLYTKCTWPTST